VRRNDFLCGEVFSGKAMAITFDVSKENRSAYLQWLRTYRLILALSLGGCAALAVAFSFLLVGALTPHPILRSGDTLAAALASAVLSALAVLLFYMLVRVYRAGGQALIVGDNAVRMVFTSGRYREVKWDVRGFRLRISAVGNVDPTSGRSVLTQLAIQDLRHPHFELTAAAMMAMLAEAKAHNLVIDQRRLALKSDRYWEVTLISSPRR
jgi:hypothetical protein